MTKTTKVIAALGVVAGLGVAALPAVTFAAGEKEVQGSADVYVEIPDAIAMTITGNNDDNGRYGTSGDNAAVDVYNPVSGDPATVDGHARPSTDPASIAAKASSAYATLTQNAKVEGSKVAASTDEDNNGKGFISDVTVYTNNKAGYKLNMKATSTKTISEVATPALLNQGDSGATYIPTGTTVDAGTSTWAYALDDGTTYAAFTTAGTDIKTRNSATSNGEETVVKYGVSTSSDQASGVYKGTVVFTATAQS